MRGEEALDNGKRKTIAFFCDQCGLELATGNMCPECKRVLCARHYFGDLRGKGRRKDGLCVRCAVGKVVSDGKTKST